MQLVPNSLAQGSGFTHADIGSVGVAGNSTYSAGTDSYTVAGSGAGIGGTTDAFQFMSRGLSGDGEIVARIVTQDNTGSGARAGLMIREGNGAGARHAFLHATISGGLYLQSRSQTGAAATATNVAGAAPVWLKLVREGTLLSGYQSADGVTWTLIDAINLPLAYEATVGVAVTSGDNLTSGAATFDHVQVTEVAAPAGVAGFYFHNADLTTLRVIRRDGSINFDWAGQPPDLAVEAGDYSVRWKGQVLPAFSETYTFYTLTDDKVRLWVNDQLIIDNWSAHSLGENSGTIALTQGTSYKVKMEYARSTGNGTAVLSWSSPSLTKEVVPYVSVQNMDLDDDGMPDVWELAHGFNPLDPTDAAADFDGDGVSNLQEYLNGTDPTDYYNGTVPTIEIAGGNNQGNLPNSLFAQAITVRIKKSGVPLSNAPVTFQINSGGGNLANASGGALTSPVGVRTDAQGYASVYFRGAASSGDTVIRATATSGVNSVQVDFAERTLVALPAGGMTVWLKASDGVTKDGSGKVSQWADYSGTSHHAAQTTGSAQPLWVANVLNGQPMIRYDGSSSYLKISTALTDFTAGCTAFVVAKPTNVASYQRFFDFGTGQNGDNIMLYRMGTTDTLEYVSLSGSTVITNLTAAGGIVQNQFQVFEALQDTSSASVYQNGLEILRGPAAAMRNVSRTSNYIGKSNWPDALFQGDIGEILVYNRRLTEAERETVDNYLNAKYALFATPAMPGNVAALEVSPTQAYLTWTLTGTATTFRVERKAAGDPSFTLLATVPGTDTSYFDQAVTSGIAYTYRVVADNMGQSSAYSAESSVTTSAAGAALPGSGLTVWLRGDAGVATDASGNVGFWKDGSSTSHDGAQTTTGNKPAFAASTLNGRPTVQFNGTSQYLGIGTALSDFTAGCTAFVVAKPTNTGNFQRFFDFGNGPNSDNIMFYRMGTTDTLEYVSFSSGSTLGTNLMASSSIAQNQFQVFEALQDTTRASVYYNGLEFMRGTSSTMRNIARTSNFIGKSNWSSDALLQGNVAEILVYNRRLTEAERQAVEKYLNAKYSFFAVPSVPGSVKALAVSPSQTYLTWTNSSAATTYRVERKAAGESLFTLLATVPGNSTSYFDQGLTVATGYTYRVIADNMGRSSAPSAESSVTTLVGIGTDIMPQNGLTVWLRADAGLATDASGNIGFWGDGSGTYHDATQDTAGNKPALNANTINGKPTVQFNGTSHYLNIPSALSDFTAGCTVFVVTKPTNVGFAQRFLDFGNGAASDNIMLYRVGSTDALEYASYSSGSTLGTNLMAPGGIVQNQFQMVEATQDTATAALFNNGVQILSGPAAALRNIARTSNYIGKSHFSSDALFQGNIAEILVYNRPLSSIERRRVEAYLDKKYLIPAMDADEDGLTNAQEAILGTDPLNPDTNGDGLLDGISAALGIDPLSLDSDGDGLTNAQELALGTNPFDPDTDHDGVPDNLDYYPLDPTRSAPPASSPGAPVITLTFPAGLPLLP